jgi:hypothetical protein
MSYYRRFLYPLRPSKRISSKSGAFRRLKNQHHNATTNQMKTKSIIRALTLLAIVTVSGGLPFAAAKLDAEAEAQKSAEQWLSLTDAGKFAESWNTAAESFQAAVSQDQWQRLLGAVRKPLGALVSRQLKSAKYTKSLPGAPDGEYVVLQFETTFANKKDAVETVTPMLDKDGQWRVSGYYIK